MAGVRRMCGVGLAVVVAVVLLTAPAEGQATYGNIQGGGGWRVKQDDSSVSALVGDRLVARYRFANVPFKPYADQFLTFGGVNVLRDAPSDHLHHHALMFAVAVDGVDFWQEAKSPGRQVHRSFEVEPAAETQGAHFTERVEWLQPDRDEVMLVEHRQFEVSEWRPADGSAMASIITWQSTLELPPGKQSAALTGSHYFGLGMRFLESMDKGGKFLNATDTPGEIVRGEERVTRATWCAYEAEASEGKPVTAVMFDAPQNLRHPATWFTMPTPFAYLAATLNLWREPLTIEAGKPLSLRYGVALLDGHATKEQIEAVYLAWVKSK